MTAPTVKACLAPPGGGNAGGPGGTPSGHMDASSDGARHPPASGRGVDAEVLDATDRLYAKVRQGRDRLPEHRFGGAHGSALGEPHLKARTLQLVDHLGRGSRRVVDNLLRLSLVGEAKVVNVRAKLGARPVGGHNSNAWLKVVAEVLNGNGAASNESTYGLYRPGHRPH